MIWIDYGVIRFVGGIEEVVWVYEGEDVVWYVCEVLVEI